MTEGRRRRTILLVDDEETFLLSLADVLPALDDGLDVAIATDGKAALDLLRRRHIDLLITDIKMPGIDGFQLLETAIAENPGLPMMVMTSVGSPGVEARARDLGIGAYFEKPLDLDELITSIRRVLSEPDSTGSVEGDSHGQN
jgi:DNA-binding NtrC family response regulator